MPFVYQAITCNYLHASKKIFKTIEEAINHIKSIIDIKEDWVKNEQVHKSYIITKIDTKELPEYSRIFKETAAILPPEPPSSNDLGIKRILKPKIEPVVEKQVDSMDKVEIVENKAV